MEQRGRGYPTAGRRRAAALVVVDLLALGLLTLALLLLDASPYVVLVDGAQLPWWALAASFAAAELVVFRVRTRRETIRSSLTELPLVLGVLLLPPVELVGAAVLGSAVTLAVRRTTPRKAFFNLCLVALESALAGWVVSAHLVGHGASALAVAAVVLGLVVLLALVSAAAVTAALCLVTWRLDLGVLRTAASTGSVSAVGTASVALLLLALADSTPEGLLPLAVVVAVLAAAYRAHVHLQRHHARLEDVHRLVARVGSSAAGPPLAEVVLREVREVMSTSTATLAWEVVDGTSSGSLTLVGDDVAAEAHPRPDAWWGEVLSGAVEHAHRAADGRSGPGLAVPLGSDGHQRGVLVVEDRARSCGAFSAEDVRQLRLAADHAALALQRAHLVELLQVDLEAQEHASRTDELTGLPNRGGLLHRLDDALAEQGAQVSVLVVDLDGFSDVNEALGREVGDAALRAAGRRLGLAAGRSAVVARLGDDEFAVLLVPEVDDPDECAAGRARGLLAALTGAGGGGVSVDLGATAGLASGEVGDDGSALLQRAETALAAARAERVPLRVWSARDEAAAARRLALVADLRAALLAEELEVHYQPVVRPAGGTLLGVEALVRWTSPQHGRVPPDEFVPLAERSGLVQQLTAVVLRQALADLARWRRVRPAMTVAVNLSTRSLQDPACAADVRDALAGAGLPPSALVLEITETSALADDEQTAASLGALRRLGVRLSVDDFGTGHSSLAYLQVLPVGEVKIDRSFVGSMLGDRGSAAIVRAAVQLGRDLDLHVVAEGVEDAATLAALAGLGVDAVQGYLVARPMPAAELAGWADRCGAEPLLPVQRPPAAVPAPQGRTDPAVSS